MFHPGDGVSEKSLSVKLRIQRNMYFLMGIELQHTFNGALSSDVKNESSCLITEDKYHFKFQCFKLLSLSNSSII